MFNEDNPPLCAQCIANKSNQLYSLYLASLQRSLLFKNYIPHKPILERKKAVQPNGCTALIHQLFSSEWQ